MASSVSPSSSASQGSGSSEVSMLEPLREPSRGDLVVELRQSGVVGREAFELMRMYYQSYLAYAGQQVDESLGASCASVSVASGKSSTKRRSKRRGRRNRSNPGSDVSKLHRATGLLKESLRDFDVNGRCYAKLVAKQHQWDVNLGSFPTFFSVLSSPSAWWDRDKVKALYVRRIRGDSQDVYHVATHGVSCMETFSDVASVKSWPVGSLGQCLLAEQRDAGYVFKPCVVKLDDVLGGDRNLPDFSSSSRAVRTPAASVSTLGCVLEASAAEGEPGYLERTSSAVRTLMSEWQEHKDTDRLVGVFPQLVYLHTQEQNVLGSDQVLDSTGFVQVGQSLRGNAWSSLKFRSTRYDKYYMVMLPARWQVKISGVEYSGSGNGTVLLSRGEVDVELMPSSQFYGYQQSVFVRVLNEKSWRQWSEHMLFLPARASMHRLARKFSAVATFVTHNADGEMYGMVGLPKVKHDEEDEWLAVTELSCHGEGSGKVVHWRTDSLTGTVVRSSMLETTILESKFEVKVPEFMSVVMTSPEGHVPFVPLADLSGGTCTSLFGVKDDYCFDDGGPSGDESVCSGEEFGG